MPTPALPPGFTLDAPAGAASAPPLPPGFTVDKPSIFPGWATDLAKFGPGFLLENAKMLGRGGLTALANLGEGAGALAGEGMRGPNVTNSPKPQTEIAAALPDSLGNSVPERILRAGMEGAGGALATPIPGVGIAKQLLTGAAGGMGGEAGGIEGENLFPNSPKLQAASRFLTALFSGGAAGFGLGPRQTQGAAEVRSAAKGLTPQDFNQAEQNAVQTQNAGAKTATGAEMFPQGSGIMALAAKTRAMGGDNPLRIQTANRPGDISDLADEFLNRVNPTPVDPNAVANSAAGSANGVLAETKTLRGTALSNQLAGETVPHVQIANLQGNLLQAAQAAIRPGQGNAYRQVAAALLDQQGQPITNVQQLSLAIKSLKTAAKNPNSPIFSGGAIDAVDLNHAIQDAEAGLASLNPAFKTGMQDFRDFSRGPMTAERQGPIGSLADRNPMTAGQTPVSRLEGLLSGNEPSTIEGTARTLQSPVMTGDNPTSALDIARALAQRRLNSGPMDPGNAMRGTEGSNAQAQFEALLNAGGNNAAQTMAPLAVADRLQPFLKPASMNDVPKMSLGQAFLRPFRTADMAITGNRLTGLNEEVGRLLADPSPANIRRLQEISMFDPNVRRIFSAKSGILPAVAGGEQ